MDENKEKIEATCTSCGRPVFVSVDRSGTAKLFSFWTAFGAYGSHKVEDGCDGSKALGVI